MKDLVVEIQKALSCKDLWREVDLVEYLINKKGYNFRFEYYSAGKEIIRIFNGDDLIGLLHARFPLGFILETAYEDFKDLSFYHVVKVDSLEKAEWSVDKQELKNIAPEITWLSGDEVVNSKAFSLQEFAYATN